MRLPVRCLSIAACMMGLVGGAGGAAMAEQIDNPAYVSWAKYKPGTTVSYKQTMQIDMPNLPAGMGAHESTMSEKLVEVKPDAATVEVSMKMTMNGQERDMPTRTITVPAKIEKGQEGVPQAGPSGGPPPEIKDMKVGKDTLDVNGKSVEATTREFTMVSQAPRPMNAHMKTWYTPDVPGGMVRNETQMDQPVKTTSTTTLVDFNVVK